MHSVVTRRPSRPSLTQPASGRHAAPTIRHGGHKGMAFSKGNRFSTIFDTVPSDVVLRGDVAPGTEHHRADWVTGRPARRTVPLARPAAESVVARVRGAGRPSYRTRAGGRDG